MSSINLLLYFTASYKGKRTTNAEIQSAADSGIPVLCKPSFMPANHSNSGIIRGSIIGLITSVSNAPMDPIAPTKTIRGFQGSSLAFSRNLSIINVESISTRLE
ncbi:hypothetical protein LC1Nh_0495 [Candidatus Nanohalobium constans]|uniref:Uncharacterized protein n=1 Tax=Candidatus Nanohalobium constans TaxID=2565781 RepID=A0A5Q0UHH0_9ARCH|nr:hypothetical protein LC1Nh_0495 [Candidatus Nanohalobium constans]